MSSLYARRVSLIDRSSNVESLGNIEGYCRSVVRAPIVRKEGLVCRLIYEEKRLLIHKVVPPQGSLENGETRLKPGRDKSEAYV